MVNVLAEAIMGSEVIGEGTSTLRSFNTIDVLATTHLDKIIGIDRDFEISIGYWAESTNRDGAESYEDIALDVNTFTAGLNF